MWDALRRRFPRCNPEASVECPHPNEFDLKRIERRITERQRYRYVSPEVLGVENGYEIRSPCCSRNIDKSGGTIDIARIVYMDSKVWRLYSKAHAEGRWIFHAEYESLSDLLNELNLDPERRFWQ